VIVEDTIKSVFERHDRIILSEDDNVFGPHFLSFINEGLEKFSTESRVAAICGHIYPGFPANESRAVALQTFSPWGFGLWRDKASAQVMLNPYSAARILHDSKEFSQVNAVLPHIAPMLRSVKRKTLHAPDLAICTHIVLDNKVSIFPSKSLVRNMGNDGSGLRSVPDERFAQQEISERPVDFKSLRRIDPEVPHNRWIRSYFGGTWSALAGRLVFAEANSRNRYTARLCWFVARAIWWLQRVTAQGLHKVRVR